MFPGHPTRRRWFRFSLRTLLVLVTVVCIVCGYLGWAMNWKRQRNEYLDNVPYLLNLKWANHRGVPAPLALRLLGARGVSIIVLPAWPNSVKRVKRLIQLFPEAHVRVYICMEGMPAEEWLALDPADQVDPDIADEYFSWEQALREQTESLP